jgi:hypothetical protein
MIRSVITCYADPVIFISTFPSLAAAQFPCGAPNGVEVHREPRKRRPLGEQEMDVAAREGGLVVQRHLTGGVPSLGRSDIVVQTDRCW